MKSLVDDWFETCSIIVQDDGLKNLDGKQFIQIRLFLQGTPPNRANLVMSADTEVFTKLEYTHNLDSNNRALLTTLPMREVDQAKKNILVEITPFKRRFSYSFRAHVTSNRVEQIRKGEVSYGAFIQFPSETDSEICRVEEASVFNTLVGGGALQRFIALTLLVILLTGAITLLRK